MMPTRLRTHTGRSAFTLVELLVVIGIIIVLMGILFPAISHIRRAAQVADTQNEISQIANACNAYYTTFNAYPGPLSNDYIEGVNASAAVTPPALVVHQLDLYDTSTSPPRFIRFTPPRYNITASENLVLGLMGGLRLFYTTPDNTVSPPGYTNALAPTEVGLGPLNLNQNFPGRTPTFFPNGTTYLMWCMQNGGGQIIQTTVYQSSMTPVPFVDAAGTPALGSPIPVFVDRFPTPGPLPILYLRARTGAKGVVSDGIVTDPTTKTLASYQYDIRDICAYTNTHIGLPGTDSQGNPILHNLNGLGAVSWPLTPPPGSSSNVVKTGSPKPLVTTNLPDAFNYFINAANTPTDPTNANTTNNTGRPRAVDQFILISAGPDGIYGTADDITSVGDVSQ